jgi:2-polyprenyl-6-methoxyphenol hydroxylase-like FAD-dependent oxidoreductase
MNERRTTMSHPVLIVGAGPVGLLLACELGRMGVATVVLERRAEPDPRTPGMAVNGAVVELLDERELLEPLRQYSMELSAAHFSQLWLDIAPLEGRHEKSLILPQWRIEEVLEARAGELGVTVRRGGDVTGLEQDETSVTVTVRTAEGTEAVTGSYLVACDGVDSTVRRLAAIGFPLREGPFYGLIGDIEADWSDLLPEQVGAHYSPVGGTYAGSPAEPGVWRISTAEWGVEPPDPDAPVTLEEMNERVLRLTGTEFKTATPRWLARTGNPTANAESYRSGRVFLAGDAAHVFFPFNGQRLSAGFQDAVNLGWKLTGAIEGWAPPELLDTYHAERHPAVEGILSNIHAQEALVHPPDRALPLRDMFTHLITFKEVNEYLVHMMMGLDTRYPPASGDDPSLGRRLPRLPLRALGTDPAGALRSGRGVLLLLSPADTPADVVAEWNGRVEALTAGPVPGIDAAAVLLRPDGHVAWTTRSPGDTAGLRQALRTWFGAPETTP